MRTSSFALLSALALASAVHAQQILVPPGQTMTSTGSSTGTWRSTLFRFQMMYDNSNFAGVVGPITINRLRFRTLDGTLNLGGQTYPTVNVRLYDTPTAAAVVLAAATTAASTTTSISAAGLIASQYASGAADTQRCFTLTFTSGANTGLTRFISANTATAITVSVAFPVAPAIGDAYTVTRAPINYNNMAQNFAANTGASVGALETFLAVPILPAAGTNPNSYTIDLPLGISAFAYDPATMGNLVIDIDVPAAPAPITNFPSFSTSSVAATSKARRNSTGTAGATFGALSDFASVCLIDFVGVGGNNLLAATATSYGGACAQTPNVNQYFGGNGLTAQQQDFDLAGKSLRFTPDNPLAPTNYSVTGGVVAPDLTQAVGVVNTSDDDVVPVAPAWLAPFPFPGGTCVSLGACMNGFVWLGAGVTDFSPSIVEWLGNGASNLGARVAPCWKDMHGAKNLVSHPLSGMYNNTVGVPGSLITYITWREIGEFNNSIDGASVSTFQVVLFEASSEIEIRYGAMAPLASGTAGVITGFTRGTLGGGVNSIDSGSRDLSVETPFTSNPLNGSTSALTLTTSARPIVGTASNMTVTGMAPTDTLGLWLYDLGATQPGVPIPGITDAGCIFSLTAGFGFFIDFIGPAPVSSTSLGWPAPPYGIAAWPAAFVGAHLYVQYTSAPGVLVNHRMSNALDLRLGYQ